MPSSAGGIRRVLAACLRQGQYPAFFIPAADQSLYPEQLSPDRTAVGRLTHAASKRPLLARTVQPLILGLWTRLIPFFLVFSPALHAQSAAPTKSSVGLPRIELRAGMHRILAEVASTDETRSRGLMFRDKLGPNEGMLFVFRDKAPHCFWMRNTLIPLSIAFIRDDGSIVNIAEMQPRTDDSHCAIEPVRYALEMDKGWFESKGIKVGSRFGNAQYFGSP